MIAEYKKCKREREISKAIKELKQSYEKIQLKSLESYHILLENIEKCIYTI